MAPWAPERDGPRGTVQPPPQVPIPAQQLLTAQKPGSPCVNHTPQTRPPPGERADKPASCSEFQICNPPPLQVKLWHDQKSLN